MAYLGHLFEISRKGSRSYPAMEGLRGIAVFLVFLVHFNSLFVANKESFWVLITTPLGHTGVELFFILSGYLIYGSLINKKSFSTLKYAKDRAKRLYPVFFALSALYILIYLFVMPSISTIPEGSDGLKYVLANLTMQPYVFGFKPMMTVAWTLAYEVTFYAILPIFVIGLAMNKWGGRARLVMLCVCLLATTGYFSFTNGAGPERIVFFFAGMLLAESKKHLKHQFQRKQWAFLGLIMALGSASLVHIMGWPLMWAVSLGVVGWWLVVGHALYSEKPATSLTFTPLRYLGNMSYSYYLSHSLAIHASYQIFNAVNGASVNTAIELYLWGVFTFAATLAFSAGVFLLVERPFSLRSK
jgi:exopolysaccharide production protein ExoZ